jgi:TRAP-type transport system small permease protein
MAVIKALSDGLEKILKISGIIALSLMVAMIFLNILSRTIFQETFGVTEEWPVWLMIWSVFIFIGLDIKEKAHIAVDIIPDMLKGNKRIILNICIAAIMLVFGILFLYACWSDVLKAKMIHVTTITSIPVQLWIVKICMPLGMIFFIFHSIEQLMTEIQTLRGGGKK